MGKEISTAEKDGSKNDKECFVREDKPWSLKVIIKKPMKAV